MSAKNAILSAVLRYIARGWRVLPVAGKMPTLKDWTKKASTDPQQIQDWWNQQPTANVGIATGAGSNLLVLDVDPDKGGEESLRRLEEQHGPLPITPQVLTGGGGQHYYFQYPNVEIKNSTGKLGRGLDIRAEGGQVVAPPSVHPKTGRTYEWEGAHHPDDIPLAAAPDWLLTLLTAKTMGRAPETTGVFLDGDRNDSLTREAGKLRRNGLSQPELEAALLAMNKERCQPPLSDHEVRKIATSVARYSPKDATVGVSRALFRRVSDIQARPIRWLWEERIARGKVSMIAGNPGLGKSQVTASMAAVVSTGGTWPVDGTPCQIGNIVILSAEDDPEDTLRPRLEAAGADLSRVFILDAIAEGTGADGSEIRRGFDLKTDLSRLGVMLEKIGGAALVVIDPITAYLGATDSHKNAEIRALLSPLADLSAKHGAAVVCVSHFNKNSNGEALMRVTGSLAFVAAARAVFVVARDPEDDARRLLLPLKNNLGNDKSGLAFSVESVQLESSQGPIKTSRVSWHAGTVTTTADMVMSPQPAGEERGELEEAKGFLQGLLADGPLASKEIKKDAEGAGHAWRTIQRAQKSLKILACKDGMKGGWRWRLPSHSPPEERHNTTKSATHEDWHSSGSGGGLQGGHGGAGMPAPETPQSELPLESDQAEEVIDVRDWGGH